jgi:D-serine dehydratase
MRPVLAGVFTVEDDTLFHHLHLAAQTEQLRIEPSAAAGFSGPAALQHSDAGQQYLAQHGLQGCMHQATHVVWTTGGLFVPEVEYARFAARGAALHDAAAALAH